MAAFEAWLVFLILVVNVVGELQRKRTLAASRGFLAAARLSCFYFLMVTRGRRRRTLRDYDDCLSVCYSTRNNIQFIQ